MVDANIPDIALEPDKTVKKVTRKLSLSFNNESHHVMKFSVTCGHVFVAGDVKILATVL